MTLIIYKAKLQNYKMFHINNNAIKKFKIN